MDLIVVACLLAAPAECKEHRVRLTLQGGDPGQCMYVSPPQIAKWQLDHPVWRVKSWRCAVVSKDEMI
jgi:hypothetical protein